MSHLHETPWHVVKHGEDGFLVCLPSGHAILWTYEEEVANLLASAQDLLAAARLGLENFENELQCTLECGCLLDDALQPIRSTLEERAKLHVEEIEQNITTIRAAIAKAEGRS